MNIEHDDEEEKIPEVTPETIIEDEEPPAYSRQRACLTVRS